MPARAKTLVPVLFSVPCWPYYSPPCNTIVGHVGVGLDVVQQRRLVPQAALGRERRTRTRFAAVAFDRGQQRRFFAADEGPGAHADFQVEVESGPENVLAQQPVVASLFDGRFQSLDRQADTRPARRRSPVRHRWSPRRSPCLRSPRGDRPPDAAVHERAGIAFVGVADDILLVARPPGA